MCIESLPGKLHPQKRPITPSVTTAERRRISALYAALRQHQNHIHHAYLCVDLWNTIKYEIDTHRKTERFRYYINGRIPTGETTPYFREQSLSERIINQTMTEAEAIEICLGYYQTESASEYTRRWIRHLLNRIAYEREQLGSVELFSGPLTHTDLQAFAQEYGTYKPYIQHNGDDWLLSSALPLPECILTANRSH